MPAGKSRAHRDRKSTISPTQPLGAGQDTRQASPWHPASSTQWALCPRHQDTRSTAADCQARSQFPWQAAVLGHWSALWWTGGREASHCSLARQRAPKPREPQESGCPQSWAEAARLPPARSPCWSHPYPKPSRCRPAGPVSCRGREGCLGTGSSGTPAEVTPRFSLPPRGTWTEPGWHRCGSHPRTCKKRNPHEEQARHPSEAEAAAGELQLGLR